MLSSCTVTALTAAWTCSERVLGDVFCQDMAQAECYRRSISVFGSN